MNTAADSWASPSSNITLSSNAVHVWRVTLDVHATIVHSLFATLCATEKQRAERFYLQLHRDRFIVGRGVLRQILASYLQIHPSEINFSYNSYGKPSLVVADAEPLRFNLSHSQELALIAVTQSYDIGVDLESVRSDFPCQQIAERFFSPTEVAVLRSLPPDLQTTAFFTCWTRKEAFIKATGKGLSLPLDTFDVSLIPGEPAKLLYTAWDESEAQRWALQEIIPGFGYVGAIALPNKDWDLKRYQYNV
ncbi:4'-phosphopantetheinyl transferase family protein [Gloeocapsopsis dulcis]|uniref:Phosphopantetheine-protein transferase n=1 Tax=Gloeocapsopsis dulcis AAB1 = 1H9 TaxID=1433147 RepID=A0A6N8G2N3_9CHRO|nr:4'-phosphopantetheinyl transferase superfamily protein [Gloeocapsopsis dulcis]MUL38597.1 phosphopantetheine-protein transferase [Gloeocapsopsis dulcis AAB1 = 1H9]WNN91157.1 4'-phosphopantetheinyl transferase superfamily protein [Gloeocapsopsis dulcis]